MLGLKLQFKLTTMKANILCSSLYSTPIRSFAKKRRRVKEEQPEFPGLRKSNYNPYETNTTVDEEVYVGPTWVISPKDVYNIDGDKDSSHNWIKQELQVSLNKNFPQHTSSSHRGLKFSNKILFNHPKLYLMTSEKIRSFIINKQIQRVFVFSDGWEDTQFNDEYGKLYINPQGKIISGSPDERRRKDIPEGFTQVKLPIAYLLRDLVSECNELEDKVQIFVFQNLKYFTDILTKRGRNVAIDKSQVSNRLLSLRKNNDGNQEFYNKLIVTSLVNSLVKVKDVHSIFMPLILAYSNPGFNTAAFVLYKSLINGFNLMESDGEPSPIPNLTHDFSLLTSERVCEMI